MYLLSIIIYDTEFNDVFGRYLIRYKSYNTVVENEPV